MNDKLPLFPTDAIKKCPRLALLVYATVFMTALVVVTGFDINYTVETHNHYYSNQKE